MEVFIMDKKAIAIAAACYLAMAIIIYCLYFVR